MSARLDKRLWDEAAVFKEVWRCGFPGCKAPAAKWNKPEWKLYSCGKCGWISDGFGKAKLFAKAS